MRNHLRWSITFLLIISSSGILIQSQSISIKGKLVDNETERMISNAMITLNPGNKTTITDSGGEYNFASTTGMRRLSVQILGYRPATVEFNASSDTIINIHLQVLPYELGEVTVTGNQVINVRVTQHGNLDITPAAVHETPRIFSEPDLMKSLQLMPGVVAGKDGSSDLYVRGGGSGQNIILANGCYFFLPSHFLGIISPIDLDFLENAELYKDYFPAELGGGASSVISLQFKKPQSDSLRAQLRLGMLSSGFTIEMPFKKLNLNITAGLKRGNYAIYAPVHKKIVSDEISEFLPSDNYSFYDGFLRVDHSSKKSGNISYLFFGNYDKGADENELFTRRSADTTIFNLDRISNGWKSAVHSLQWELPVRNVLRWKFDLNYNMLSVNREIFHQTEKRFEDRLFDVVQTLYSFSPTVNIIGSSLTVSGDNDNFSWSTGLTNKIRYFSPNITANNVSYNEEITNTFGETTKVLEPAAFISSTWQISEKLQMDAGLRISGAFLRDACFIVPEPRIRLSYNLNGSISPHINYVRLSQSDHSVEGSNAGLRTMLWLPVSKDFGPEISDVVSAGFQGHINNNFVWTLNGYYKKIKGMVDYKSGASFVYDTTFADLLDVVKGKAYGLEAGIIKNTGTITGSFSYTYSRSKRDYWVPKGLIWIPSNADRPHNFNISLKYPLGTRTSFGITWVYQSGTPATIYEQEASYGEFFQTKNNIRYFDYHRLDLSLRQVIYKRKFSISIDADIYNVYNRQNTFYFKKLYNGWDKIFYYKNISLFPIMPTITLLIK